MLTEDLNHEFKIQYTKDIIKTVIVFGNTSGGKIYIGVNDAGNGIGINDPDEELRSLNQNLTFEVLTKEFRKSDIQMD